MTRRSPQWARGLAVLTALLLSWVAGSAANAEEKDAAGKSVESLFQSSRTALESGGYSDAIMSLEQLSDRGVTSASISYNRALAYLLRAESPKKRDGDLGQAVAGLREAQLLGDQDEAIVDLLNAVRKEISRQRAQQGQDPVVVKPPLGRALVGLAPENAWAAAALLGALALSVGWLLWRRVRHAHTRLAGQITASVGLGLLLLFGSLAALSRHYRTSSREAVVISAQAKLLSATGEQLKQKTLDVESSSVPEGALVYMTGQSGRLTQVNWGSDEAWLETKHLRALASP